jgi:hypothetical protein
MFTHLLFIGIRLSLVRQARIPTFLTYVRLVALGSTLICAHLRTYAFGLLFETPIVFHVRGAFLCLLLFGPSWGGGFSTSGELPNGHQVKHSAQETNRNQGRTPKRPLASPSYKKLTAHRFGKGLGYR